MRGKLITIEGTDGSGKTSVAREVEKFFTVPWVQTCIYSKEPGKAWDGKVRQILLEEEVCPMAELFLFLADRAQHVNDVVVPQLKKGNWVVLDRYCDSTVVYQSYIRGIPSTKIMELNWMAALHAATPDLTIVLDIEPEIAMERLAKRASSQIRLGEREGIETIAKIREGFLQLAEANPKRIIVVDSNRELDEVCNNVLRVISENLH